MGNQLKSLRVFKKKTNMNAIFYAYSVLSGGGEHPISPLEFQGTLRKIEKFFGNFLDINLPVLNLNLKPSRKN